MSRSTFSILPYINRQKVKADGTANILCRITVDGKSAAISTGISCTPQEWNGRYDDRDNERCVYGIEDRADFPDVLRKNRQPDLRTFPSWK